MVYVQRKDGQPLMPTDRHGKVKHLLREGKAIVVKRCPFTITYGYITKNTRITNKLIKTHCVDAKCITGNWAAKSLEIFYLQKAVRRHNRQIHKANILKGGYRKANQAPKNVCGFGLFDNVKFEKQSCHIFGRRSNGYFDLRRLDGVKIHASANYKKLKLIEKAKTILIERRKAIPPLP